MKLLLSKQDYEIVKQHGGHTTCQLKAFCNDESGHVVAIMDAKVEITLVETIINNGLSEIKNNLWKK